ncbi:MAG: hypothetical protein R3359_02650 [Marinirhabdus sp.]|nr:hypothetical protein [Marinirhabdus sp.]
MSCSNDDTSPEQNLEFVTAIYDGDKNFESSPDTKEIEFNRADIESGNRLKIKARHDRPHSNFVSIYIDIKDYNGVGTYSVGDSEEVGSSMKLTFGRNDFSVYTCDYNERDMPGFEPGTLIITKDDGEIMEGTFSFKAFETVSRSIEVTNGKFKIGLGVYPRLY